MQTLAGRELALAQRLAGAAGDADMKCDGHRLFQKVQREAKRRTDPDLRGRFPVAEHPVRRSKTRPRWQVSRLAEQGLCPSIPAFPIPGGISGFGHLSGHGRGGGCILDPNPADSDPIAFPLRLS
ncbi:hypothetical protein GCM10010987_18560 [Bradyrhizobium guangdongense]|uniref:Uncharacterized protein n=1 Tax=Bradyrhizobium guangdongense TaxID=1325090 RepID=A0AA87W5D1_9BRAD|nr:hypothetical protein GCM10010987_18560 [Bradyrhizobium guangdongense]